MPLTQVIGNYEDAINAAPLPPFDDGVIDFLNALSRKLMGVRGYSDVSTFGFWCRRANLLKERAKYDDLALRLGRGVVFHSTPSNVAVNFAFSFAAGLLAGNANVVRLPARDFDQVRIICSAIGELLTGEFGALAPYVSMVKYPPDRKLHDLFSSIADVRVVWGGDATIAELRGSSLKPRATEITFADRHSIAVIDARAYLAADDFERIAQDFYNDTYFTDQNACTAPRFIFWLNDESGEGKEVFWRHAERLAIEKYELSPVQAVGKLNAYCLAAAEKDVKLIRGDSNMVYRVAIEKPDADLVRFKYNSGFFFECDIADLSDILPVCDERCQTLTYLGVDSRALERFIAECRPKGVDRAVPMGKSMNFTLVWDGYDLIRQMSRRVSIV